MDIRKKIHLKYDELSQHGPITIVAFGDSVTHGALSGEYDQETVYWNQLRRRIIALNPYMPVNVINAGIGGITAKESIGRMDAQVLQYNPDLIIICFGLNDVNRELKDYLEAMETIFAKAKASGAEVIFMTPNMLNTYVAEDTAESLKEFAAITAEAQNSGRMDRYMQEVTALAQRMQVTVCDCYARWKELSQTQDTTRLLCNRINHPTREMHQLFADCLFETIFGGDAKGTDVLESSMFEGRK